MYQQFGGPLVLQTTLRILLIPLKGQGHNSLATLFYKRYVSGLTQIIPLHYHLHSMDNWS